MQSHRWLYAWGLGSVAFGAASLLVPLYLVALGGDPFDLGLLAAVAAFVGAPGAIVWGRLADRTRHKRAVVLASLAGVAVTLGALPFLASIPLVIVVNAVLWLMVAAGGPVLTLLVVADVPEREWSAEIAALNAYQGYGWALGLVLGLVWNAVVGRFYAPVTSLRGLLLVCGVIALVSIVAMARWMPEPAEARFGRIDPRRVARLLSESRRGIRGATFAFNPTRLYWSTRAIHPRELASRFTPTLAGYFFAVVLFFTGFAAFFAPLPLFLADGVGFSSDLVFGFYLVSALASAIFYTPAGKLSSTYDLRTLQTGALLSRGVAMPLAAVVGAALSTTLAGTLFSGVIFVVVGLTWAVVAVTAGTIVTRLAPQQLRGEALGVYAALSALAGGIGSVLGGLLADTLGYTPAFLAAGGLIVAGAILVAVLRGITTRTSSGATATQ